MLEDQDKPEEELVKVEKSTKANSNAVLTKLVVLVAIVIGLAKWGVPMLEGVVDQFNKTQEGKEDVVEKEVEKEVVDEEEKLKIEVTEPSVEDKLKSAIESEINQWVVKRSTGSSVKVKFINTNEDKSRLAVEYLVSYENGESESKELLFTRDEFGIYIYEDASGVRQIRVRQPK